MIHLVLSLFILVNSCERCLHTDMVYNCGDGAIVTFDQKDSVAVCCDGEWHQCYQSVGFSCGGRCPINNRVANNTPPMLNTFVIDNGRTYTDYLTAIDIHDNRIRSAKRIHSLDIPIGTKVMWPGKDFGKTKDVVVKVARNDLDHMNPLCCTNSSNIHKYEIYCGRYCNRCIGSSSSIICNNKIHNICCPPSPFGDRAICICEKDPVCECF